MAIIIPINRFGELSEYHIYDYYDMPIFFSAVDKLSRYYLFFNAETLPEGDKWYSIDISFERLNSLESGKTSIREVFTNSETGNIYEIVTNYEKIISEKLGGIEILDLEGIPPSNDFLKFNLETEFSSIDLFNWAKQKSGIGLTIRLKSHNIGRMIAPLEAVTGILSSFQGLFNNVAYAKNTENYSQKGAVPQFISKQTQLQFAGSYSGSLGIKLLIPNNGLFESTLVGEALDTTLNLISLRNIEDIKSVVMNLKNRPLSKFKELLKNISSNELELEISKSSSTANNISEVKIINIKHEEVLDIYTALDALMENETNLLEVKGTLIGIDIQTKKFHIQTETESYKGSILENILGEDTIQRATINNKYIAQIEERKEFIGNVSEFKITYYLVAISYQSNI